MCDVCVMCVCVCDVCVMCVCVCVMHACAHLCACERVRVYGCIVTEDEGNAGLKIKNLRTHCSSINFIFV